MGVDLIEAKCTNCGGVLTVDKEKDAMICPYCGTAFVVRQAISNFVNYYNITVQNAIIREQGYSGFDIRDGMLVKYNGRSDEIIIPEGVIKIQENALKEVIEANRLRLKKIIIPGSIKIVNTFFMKKGRVDKLILCEGVEELISGNLSEVVDTVVFPSSLKKICIVGAQSMFEHKYEMKKNLQFERPINSTKAIEQFINFYDRKCIYCGGETADSILKGIHCKRCKSKLGKLYNSGPHAYSVSFPM